MTVGIVDYGAGNLGSLKRAFSRIGEKSIASSNREDLLQCDHLVVPGVGAYGFAVDRINRTNLASVVKDFINIEKKPVLGICLGMQLFGSTSEETLGVSGLSILDFKCSEIMINNKTHIGWNSVKEEGDSILLKGIDDLSDFYFVHTYGVKEFNADFNGGITECNGGRFISIIEVNNIFLAQFHPEKSQKNGLKVLRNFCEYKQNA